MPVSTTIRVGQRVTCIDASNFVILYGENVPKQGLTYTVRSVVNNPDGLAGKCIRLNEIVNPPAPYQSGTQECCFKASRFKVSKGKG